MWVLKQRGLLIALGVLFVSTFIILGCGFRALTDQDVAGTYQASADWGRSTLVLHPNHSFEQTVVRNNHTQTSINGTWRLDLFAGKNASHGIIFFRPFLWTAHNHKGDLAGGAGPSISRGFFWGITIAADPDYGISFDKQ